MKRLIEFFPDLLAEFGSDDIAAATKLDLPSNFHLWPDAMLINKLKKMESSELDRAMDRLANVINSAKTGGAKDVLARANKLALALDTALRQKEQHEGTPFPMASGIDVPKDTEDEDYRPASAKTMGSVQQTKVSTRADRKLKPKPNPNVKSH